MATFSALRACARLSTSLQGPATTLPRTTFGNRSAAVTLHQKSQRLSSNMPAAPRFAEGEDAAHLGPDVQSLLQQQGWALDADGMGITKTFHFKTYFKAVSFLNLIASESAAKKHHPTMTVVRMAHHLPSIHLRVHDGVQSSSFPAHSSQRIGSVDVHWTTHRPRGLTIKDVTLARHCDQGAVLMGAVESGEGAKCGPKP